MGKNGLGKKVPLLFVIAIVACALIIFLPAGTLEYWQGWAYIAATFVPAAFVVSYFVKKDPEFLKRRMKMKEKEAKQGVIQIASGIVFFIGFVIPGLDYRFGWSNVPFEFAIAADVIVFLGYLLVFWVFRENSYAGRTVVVEKGQKVISTGPYAIVRHPMYSGVIAMFLATPIALGSYWAFPIFLLLVPLLVARILNEEEVLKRDLKGYIEYCKKTKYRLLPLVW